MARTIGGPDAIAIVAGSMLGVGIFLSPALVAAEFASRAAFLMLWALGGLTALAGAAAYAQLGVMVPRAGGDYVYLRAAYGQAVAAAGGWILAVAVFPGSLATMAVAVGEYQLPVLLHGLGYSADAALAGIPAPRVVAVALIVGLTLVNAAGAHLSARTQRWLTAAPVVFLIAMVVAAIVGIGSVPAPHPHHPVTGSWVERFTAAYMAVYFAYSGWNAVGYVGGEVERPRRNIPIGLVGGTLLVTALYLALCWTFLRVLGLDGVSAAPEVGTATASALFGASAAVPVAAIIAVAIVGSLNATVLGGARIAFAMACDGALPDGLTVVAPRARTPVRALWLQCGVASALVVSGTFEQLLAMTSLAMLILGILTVSSLFVLQSRGPAVPLHRRLLMSALPAVYLAFAVFVVGASIHQGAGELAAVGRPTGEFVFGLLGLVVFAAVLAIYGVRGLARTRAVR
ncbi:MAG: amino acid permease [Myxococcales bacterium]|nr:amino acid permease [Myxococcales bacterium]MCB9520566.1 amino acid permease [Myxococcales bacterium]MCB9531489.1 amino acid permease [Myxococcales bacterium]